MGKTGRGRARNRPSPGAENPPHARQRVLERPPHAAVLAGARFQHEGEFTLAAPTVMEAVTAHVDERAGGRVGREHARVAPVLRDEAVRDRAKHRRTRRVFLAY